MSFFDPRMTNTEILPNGWENYKYHVEINLCDEEMVNYLRKTGWHIFSNGGYSNGNPEMIDVLQRTLWLGINDKDIIY